MIKHFSDLKPWEFIVNYPISFHWQCSLLIFWVVFFLQTNQPRLFGFLSHFKRRQLNSTSFLKPTCNKSIVNRLLIPILENYHQYDGHCLVTSVLTIGPDSFLSPANVQRTVGFKSVLLDILQHKTRHSTGSCGDSDEILERCIFLGSFYGLLFEV